LACTEPCGGNLGGFAGALHCKAGVLQGLQGRAARAVLAGQRGPVARSAVGMVVRASAGVDHVPGVRVCFGDDVQIGRSLGRVVRVVVLLVLGGLVVARLGASSVR
jgi:hypothetical protein